MNQHVALLPDLVINKIAAGEVVERPASVVKECIENALDAGSTEIHVEIMDGGKSLIRVSDNGSGMSRDDSLMSLKRHATSKIGTINDLEHIASLGFRGEALPSIASVSRMKLQTITADDVTGTDIVIEGGKLIDVADGARSQGTTIEVNNLFYNLPARRKFLKVSETEGRHVAKVITNYAIAYPDMSFTFTNNGRKTFQLYAVKNLVDRLSSIYGKKLIEQIIPIEYSTEKLKINGYLGIPITARARSAHQIMYVNQRIISSRVIYHAVAEGYHPIVTKDKHPFLVLMLEIDPELVDVNVHPTKREVRFTDEAVIHQNVMRAIKQSVRKADIVPDLIQAGEKGPNMLYRADSPSDRTGRIRASVNAFLNKEYRSGMEESRSSTQQRLFNQMSIKEQPQTYETGSAKKDLQPVLDQASTFAKAAGETAISYEGFEHIWQLHNMFIFAQVKGGALIIDQHLAHERVLYEEALKNFEGVKRPSQQLLFPLNLELAREEYLLVEEMQPLLDQIGFGLRCFGGTTLVVDAIPTSIKYWNEGSMLKELLDEMLQQGHMSSGIKENLAVSYSCKAAIKAGDPLKPEEISYMINKLFTTDTPYTCPHGKPVVIKMPLQELESRFGR